MSDLIDRQCVIDALEFGLENDYVDATELLAYVKQLPSAESEQKGKCTKINCPIQMNYISNNCNIKTCPYRTTEPEWKWIPVTKALPWNETDVLVTVRDDSGDTPWEYTSVGWRTPDGKYWVVDHEICYGVIAWMPLPKPWGDDQ